MKSAKVLTILNVIGSILAWSLFVTTAICLLFDLGGELWIGTALLYALFVGPFDILVSAIYAIIVGIIAKKKMVAPQKNKYILINALCPVISAVLIVIGLFAW